MAKNVHSIIEELKSGLEELREHFENLGSVFGGSEKTAPRGTRSRFQTNTGRVDPYKSFKFRARKRRKNHAKASSPAKKTRKKMTISPARRAQMRLQGRYMALIKHLPKAKQAQVKKVRKDKGYEAALKMMG